MILVTESTIDIGAHSSTLAEDSNSHGALVTFTGMVRDYCDDQDITALFLEHYPGMTEKSLHKIETDARARWDLGKVTIIHRVGHIEAGEIIVFIGLTSAHRKSAFEAAQFIMDILKNKAPFWKKEISSQSSQWVEAKESDKAAGDSWL
jgi:molybdopterin synthase catalytic subunit